MATKYIPEGCHAVTPYLTVLDAQREIDFMVAAFGGVERAVIRRPSGGVMHAQVQIADSLLMIGEPPDATKLMPMAHLSLRHRLRRDVEASGRGRRRSCE